MTTPNDKLKEGDLQAAVELASQSVKNDPKKLEHRWFLAELLILAGDDERADKQLDTLMTLDPRLAVAATPVRQLIRAEGKRKQFFSEGRVPDFLDGASESLQARLEAFVLLRDGQSEAAGEIVEKAECARPSLPGTLTVGGKNESFEDIRDLDDITAEVFEVLTYTGKYYWIEMNRVKLIEFTKLERPLDLIWRKARMVVGDAFDAEVFLPSVYGNLKGIDDLSRLGRKTDWIGDDKQAVIGVGGRSFVLDGEKDINMAAIETLDFSA